jgi:predicted  nucleic acid-binding Zn-ribbon protein
MQNYDWTRWVLGIIAALVIAAVIAVWKLVAGKVDKPDLATALEGLDREIKNCNLRIDQSLAQIAQSVSKTDLMDKMTGASTRADDKDLRVQRDIAELKTDAKALTEKLTAVDKKLDEIPARVASLELTRNQQGGRPQGT